MTTRFTILPISALVRQRKLLEWLYPSLERTEAWTTFDRCLGRDIKQFPGFTRLFSSCLPWYVFTTIIWYSVETENKVEADLEVQNKLWRGMTISRFHDTWTKFCTYEFSFKFFYLQIFAFKDNFYDWENHHFCLSIIFRPQYHILNLTTRGQHVYSKSILMICSTRWYNTSPYFIFLVYSDLFKETS